jgi:hypothetical protein
MSASCKDEQGVAIGPSITDITGKIRALGKDQHKVSIKDVLEVVGEASFVPAMLVPALVVVTPLSGIPALSSICGITIALIAAQYAAGRDHVWLPDWLLRRKVSGTRLCQSMVKISAFTKWLDRVTTARITIFFHRPLKWLLPLACFLFGAAMPFLELVPFSSSLLGLCVVLISVALLTRDGLLAMIGFLPAAGAIYVLVWLGT